MAAQSCQMYTFESWKNYSAVTYRLLLLNLSSPRNIVYCLFRIWSISRHSSNNYKFFQNKLILSQIN